MCIRTSLVETRTLCAAFRSSVLPLPAAPLPPFHCERGPMADFHMGHASYLAGPWGTPVPLITNPDGCRHGPGEDRGQLKQAHLAEGGSCHSHSPARSPIFHYNKIRSDGLFCSATPLPAAPPLSLSLSLSAKKPLFVNYRTFSEPQGLGSTS